MRFAILLCAITASAQWQRPHNMPLRLQWAANGFRWRHGADVTVDAPSRKEGFYNHSVADKKHTPSSQLGQDVHVSEYFNHKRKGFFIDLAAHHYDIISNTYYLETQYDWNGICIEPNPKYTDGILEHRKCILVTNAVSEYSSTVVPFTMRDEYVGPGQDNTVAAQTTPLVTVTLNAILLYLRAPQIIEYLSLDVEGGEFDVLKHFDFGMFTILILGIERPQENTHQLLVQHGYWFMRELGTFGEETYIHNSMYRFDELMVHFKSTRDSGPWASSRPYLHSPVYAHKK